MADVKAFDIGKLWVILNGPDGLNEGLSRWSVQPLGLFINEFEAEFNGSPIRGPEGEFRCDGAGSFCVNCDLLNRIPRVLVNDRVPQGRIREKFLRDSVIGVLPEHQ